MREKNIENKIKTFLKSIGAYCVKYHGNKFSQVGVADLLVCYKGRFLAIEIKNEIGKPSALQEANILMVKQAGGISFIARSLEDVKEIIKDIDKVI